MDKTESLLESIWEVLSLRRSKKENLSKEKLSTTFKTIEGEEIEIDEATGDTTAADGTYVLDNGKTVVVKDGKVIDAYDTESTDDQEQMADTTNPDEAATADDAKSDESDKDAKIKELEDTIEKLNAKIAELEAKLADSEKANEDLSSANANLSKVKTELEGKVEKLSKLPADNKFKMNANIQNSEQSFAKKLMNDYKNANKK